MKNRFLLFTLAFVTAALMARIGGGVHPVQAQPAPPSRQLTPRGQSPSTFPGNAVPGQFDDTGSQSIGDPAIRPLPIRRKEWWVTNKTTWWTNTSSAWWGGYSGRKSNLPPTWWTNVPPSYWTNVPGAWWKNVPPGWWTNVSSDVWAKVPYSWWTNIHPQLTNKPPAELAPPPEKP